METHDHEHDWWRQPDGTYKCYDCGESRDNLVPPPTQGATR